MKAVSVAQSRETALPVAYRHGESTTGGSSRTTRTKNSANVTGTETQPKERTYLKERRSISSKTTRNTTASHKTATMNPRLMSPAAASPKVLGPR